MIRNTPTIKVMVVDDHDLVRHGIKTLINNQDGIEVIAEARTGEEAIEQCRVLNSDLNVIMMDVNMPECTGPELVKVVRQFDRFVSLPIVYLSTEADLERQLAAMRSGGDDFLTKPITDRHLTGGAVALGAWGGPASFDDVIVRGVSIPAGELAKAEGLRLSEALGRLGLQ